MRTKYGNVKCVWQGARNEWSKRGKKGLWPCGMKYLLTSFPYVFLSDTRYFNKIVYRDSSNVFRRLSFNCIIVTADDSSRNLLSSSSSSPPDSKLGGANEGEGRPRIYSRKLETWPKITIRVYNVLWISFTRNVTRGKRGIEMERREGAVKTVSSFSRVCIISRSAHAT